MVNKYMHHISAICTEYGRSNSTMFKTHRRAQTYPEAHSPLLFGGWSNNRILKLAGREGDGWTPTGPRSGEAVKTPSDYRRFVLEIEKGRNAANRPRENSTTDADSVLSTIHENTHEKLRATRRQV